MASKTPIEMQLTGVFGKIINYDEYYKDKSADSLLLNNFDVRDEDDRSRLDELLITSFTSDVLETKPRCHCGKWTGNRFIGKVCDSCGFPVTHPTEVSLDSILWAKVPDEVHGYINPQVYSILENAFKLKGKIELIRWMCDPTYKPKSAGYENNPILQQLTHTYKWKRSLNNFIERFDEIIPVLFDMKLVTPKSKRLILEVFIKQNRNRIFHKYMPVPNKLLFITEKSNNVTYVDDLIFDAIDVVRNSTNYKNTLVRLSQKQIETSVFKAVHKLAAFYEKYTDENLAGKPGYYRRDVYGGRLDFTARAVISSIVGPHRYDSLHIPWSVGLTILKPFILHFLIDMNYTPIMADKLLTSNIRRYNPILDKIMVDILNAFDNNRIETIFQRNPSLLPGSAQNLGVDRIKGTHGKEWEVTGDFTISLSPLVMKSYNADLDGDEMNALFGTDRYTNQIMAKLKPHRTLLDLNVPLTVGKTAALPAPSLATAANWLDSKE